MNPTSRHVCISSALNTRRHPPPGKSSYACIGFIAYCDGNLNRSGRLVFFELFQEVELVCNFLLRCLSIRSKRTTLACLNAANRPHLVKLSRIWIFRQLLFFPFHTIQQAKRDETCLFALQRDTFKDAIFPRVIVSVADAERKSDVARLHGVRRRLALWNWYRITRRTFDTIHTRRRFRNLAEGLRRT